MALQAPNSEVDICNLALDFLKQESIVQLDPPSSNAEEICARWYQQIRRGTLRIHPWNFALKRTSMTPASDSEPEFEYTHAYNLPNDFIRIGTLYTAEGDRIEKSEYEVEDGQILYNGEDNTAIFLKYIYDHTDVSAFDPLFMNLFALNLAIAIGPRFSGTETRIKTLIEMQKEAENTARSVDGQERPPRRIERSKWRDARRFGRTNQSGIAGPDTIFS